MKQDNQSLVKILKNKDTQLKKLREEKGGKKVENLKHTDFTLYHIEELTFEDDSPRKEALENVISSIRIAGVSFIYLLVGDSDGVSFYFGIAKESHYADFLELDVDDIGEDILKSSIEGNFRGSKVTQTKKKKSDILAKVASMKRVAKIVGVPSKNSENDEFQGVDRLVDVMNGDEFTLMLVADPMEADEIEEIENMLYNVYNKLSPLSKESVQESKGETITKGDSEATSESKTTGENENTSEADSHGKSIGASEGTGESSGSSSSKSSNKGANKGTNDSFTVTASKGTSTSDTEGRTYTANTSTATNTGINRSREFSDKVVNEWLEYIDEVLLKRLEYGRNRGLFNLGIYILANYNVVLRKLGNTIQALFSGVEDNKAPLSMEYIENKNEIEAIKNLQIPRIATLSSNQNEIESRLLFSRYKDKIASWVSAGELSVIAGLPQKEVVGLSLKEEVEFGLNVKQNIEKQDKLLLGHMVKSGTVLQKEVFIDKKTLNKHIFIGGVTGSGKTTTCQRLLDSADMPFMVIEPAKTEYRVLTKQYDDILIFTLGNEKVAPFRLNPFEFFEGENISSRVDMIKANIEAAFDMEAAIPQIIESALYEAYKSYGWDISTSTNSKFEDPYADGVYAFPTFTDLLKEVENVVNKQGFDERLKNDYLGSIRARLQGLMVGAKGSMLDTPRSIDFRELLERNVILELDDIKSGAEKSLLMGFVLINLNEALKIKYRAYQKENREFKHITLIEEAHRLLSKYVPGENPSKKLGVETFSDMLAEVRKYGESLIIVDQIPNKLTPEVLKNTNTKIVHRLFASDDKEAIGNTMALKEEQKEFLSNLDVGRTIVFSQDFAKPLQIQIKELDNISTTGMSEIDEEKIRKLVLEFYGKNYKRGIIQGLELYDKKPSIEEVSFLLGNSLANGWRILCDAQNMKKEVFSFDIKGYLEDKKLTDKLAFVTEYIYLKFYSQTQDDDRKEKLKTVIDASLTGKNSFTREEKAFLKLKVR